MTLRRTALCVSMLAICTAYPALSSGGIALPPPQEPAQVVITPADIVPTAGVQQSATLTTPADADRLMIDPAPVSSLSAPPPSAPLQSSPLSPGPSRDAETEPATPQVVEGPAVEWPVVEWPTPVVLDVPAETDQAVPAQETAATARPGMGVAPPADVASITPESPAPASPAFALPALASPVPALPAIPAPVLAVPAIPDTTGEIVAALAAGITEAVRQTWMPTADQRAIASFYEARGHRPLWHDQTGLTANGLAVRSQLARAGDDGLRESDYAIPRLINPGAGDLALADIRMTTLAIRYARDARGARIDPRKLSSLITPTLEIPAATAVISAIADSPRPDQALAGYQPRHPGYRALRDRLASLHQARPFASPSVRVPPGPVIRPGMRDDRISLIRARFGFAPDDGAVYDRSLATVVAGFQSDNGLPSNGILNRVTIDAMNGGPASNEEADIIANMERWRWLPADLGDEHLIVNVPEYLVRKVADGKIAHEARVIVGKPERPTPIFSDLMDHVVINPSWTIPPTILRKDILPKLESDPGYAERRGYQVIRRGNSITVRQPPGPDNALGNIKFMFPNDHAVYLHDTPSRGLFRSGTRAFSSGCIRVEHPLQLAEMVLAGTGNGWSERRLQGLIGRGERTIRLERKLPIHIVYMTQTVDAAGTVRNHDDIYGFHRRTRAALGL